MYLYKKRSTDCKSTELGAYYLDLNPRFTTYLKKKVMRVSNAKRNLKDYPNNPLFYKQEMKTQ